jgi:16S rRNA processing protein RimM
LPKINFDSFVLISTIVTTHGLKGWVKIKYYIKDVADIKKYPLVDENGNEYKILNLKHTNSIDCILAEFEGLTTIEQAQALRDTNLYTQKNHLPKLTDDEYFYNDLINLDVLDAQNNIVGVVVGVYNFGAGDILEVSLPNALKTKMISFIGQNIIKVDLQNKCVVINANNLL